MEVHFYQCGCADAASIKFLDKQNKPCHIFIDAGFERIFRQVLSDEISTIALRGEKINLWIISHIHDDHIGGAIGYVNAIKAGLVPDIVQKWWYNSPRFHPKKILAANSHVSNPTSIRQGDQLSLYLSESGKWNRADVLSETEVYQIGELKISRLSPGLEQLDQLRKKYKLLGVPLERIENKKISEAMGAGKRDYHFKVNELENMTFSEDHNIENGSSISVLTDYNGFKILWLADAHPSTIVESLKKMGYSIENPIICDWVKVAHHGSVANNSVELYQLIQCSEYVISVNGDNSHGLPNKAALVNILKARRQPKTQRYHFYFTHDDSILRSIFLVDGDTIFDDLNFKIFYLGMEKSFKITIPYKFKI